MRDLATSLHANAARFQILDIKRGSIIVTIVIVPDPLAQVYVSVLCGYMLDVSETMCFGTACYIRTSVCSRRNRPKRLFSF